MELFGIGPMELLMVFVLALIFIGPGKMPEVAASLGKALREFRAASSELTDALNAEIAEAERKKAVAAAGENGHSHSEAEAAQAEVVAQGEVDAPDAVEYSSADTPTYQYETAQPATAATVSDVLDAIAQQEAEDAARREAEEAERLAAIALEREIQNGVGPLPESLLLPSSDAPLIVVNPTEQTPPDVAAVDESPATDAGEPPPADVAEPVETVDSEPVLAVVESGESAFDTPSPTPNGESHKPAEAAESASNEGESASSNRTLAESESLEASGAGQAEVH